MFGKIHQGSHISLDFLLLLLVVFSLVIKTLHLLYDYSDSLFFLDSALLIFVFPGICTFLPSYLMYCPTVFHILFNFSRISRNICSFISVSFHWVFSLIFFVNLMKVLPFCWSLQITNFWLCWFLYCFSIFYFINFCSNFCYFPLFDIGFIFWYVLFFY